MKTTLFPERTIMTFVAALLLSIAAFGALRVSAQEVGGDEPPPFSVPSVEAPPGTVSCFDYYAFNSVHANLRSEVSSAVSGSSIRFSGELTNDNPYPIVDGALYVKIFRSRGAEKDANGPDVVDQFLVKAGIALPAKGSAPISFDWRIPAHALSGEYAVATFFTTSRKFNLLGLSFTDDVVGERVFFTVSGDASGGVSFTKSSVTVHGEPYFFAAFPPRVSKDAPVTISARVKNATRASQQAKVAWTVYQWDAQLRENAVHESSESITVPAGKDVPVSTTIEDAQYPVYYAVGTLEWQGTKSIIGVRFVREGIERIRINFPGITAFPLAKGQKATLFSCLHNSGESPIVTGGRLDLTLTDRDGNLIQEYSYDGGVTGDMMGVAKPFVPEKSYDYVQLDARLYQNGEFVDEANLVYDCRDVAPEGCGASRDEGDQGIFGKFLNPSLPLEQFAAVGLGAILVLLAALVLFLRMRRRSVAQTAIARPSTEASQQRTPGPRI